MTDSDSAIPGVRLEPIPRTAYRKNKSKAQRAAEAVMIFERRAAGYSTYAIAQELGISVGTVVTRMDEAMELIVSPPVEGARELSIRTLEVIKNKLLADWAELVPKSADQANGRGNGKREHSPKFAEALVKVEDRLAKLQGADRPVVVQMNVKLEHTGSVDDELNALAAELGLNDPSPETSGDSSPGDEPAEAGAEVTT